MSFFCLPKEKPEEPCPPVLGLGCGDCYGLKELNVNGTFNIGNIEDDSETNNDETHFQYRVKTDALFKISEHDCIYARVNAGNGTDHFEDANDGTHLSASASTSNFYADKLWLEGERELQGKNSLKYWVGPRIENYYMLAFESSNYNETFKQFQNAGNGSVYGSSTCPGMGVALKFGNHGASIGYSNQSGASPASTAGLFGDGAKATLFQVGTEQKLGSISLAYARKENGWTDSYFSTTRAINRDAAAEENAYGVRINIKEGALGVKGLRAVVGVDRSDINNQTSAGNATETLGYMAGVTVVDALPNGIEIGGAVGRRQYATEQVASGTAEAADDNLVAEIYAELPISTRLGLRLTGLSNKHPRDAGATDDISGWVLQVKTRQPLVECPEPEGGEDEDEDVCH
jgi:hypothetical protein